MTEDISITVDGLEDIKKMLSALPKEVNWKVIKDLNTRAGFKVKGIIAAGTPEGNNTRASKIKIANNVVVKPSKTTTGIMVGYSNKAFPVRFIEFGTATRATKGKGKYQAGVNRGSVPARRFFQEASDKAAVEVLEYLEQNYLKVVNQSIKKQLKNVQSNI